jgi:hypothetical protein
MINLIEIKSVLFDDILEKKKKQRINYENMKQRRKEKKRQLIEKIKEERLKNSIILDNF